MFVKCTLQDFKIVENSQDRILINVASALKFKSAKSIVDSLSRDQKDADLVLSSVWQTQLASSQYLGSLRNRHSNSIVYFTSVHHLSNFKKPFYFHFSRLPFVNTLFNFSLPLYGQQLGCFSLVVPEQMVFHVLTICPGHPELKKCSLAVLNLLVNFIDGQVFELVCIGPVGLFLGSHRERPCRNCRGTSWKSWDTASMGQSLSCWCKSKHLHRQTGVRSI